MKNYNKGEMVELGERERESKLADKPVQPNLLCNVQFKWTRKKVNIIIVVGLSDVKYMEYV